MMDAAVDHLDDNLAALATVFPTAVDEIARAVSPFTLTNAVGRDQEPTFTWTDGSRLHWHGRTSMPRVRGEALIESFQPGTGNVLLYGVGHGIELSLLFVRLAAHQAVAVIETEPWKLRAALSLTDLACSIRERRCLFFCGPGAWKGFADFFAENDGYLVPARILSWPWFEREEIAFVTDQLQGAQTDVSRRCGTANRTRAPVARRMGERAVAIVSNSVDPRVHQLCRRIEAGVRSLGHDCLRLTLDAPMLVQPRAAEAALAHFNPTAALLVDVLPENLPYRLPACSFGVVAAPAFAAAQAMQECEANGRTIFALGETMSNSESSDGGPVPHAHSIAPAALPGLEPVQAGDGILVLADRCETSPATVGLHLTSHVRLWDETARLIRARIDEYHDAMADPLLGAAEKNLGIRFDSDEVRAGILERIRLVLGPQLVRSAYLETLEKAAVPNALSGRGWSADHAGGRRILEPWKLDGLGRAFAEFGAVVFVGTGSTVPEYFLDALACGLVGFVRNVGYTGSGGGTIRPGENVAAFDTRESLVKSLAEFRRSPAGFGKPYALTGRAIREQHTWAHRVRAMLAALETRTPCGAKP